MSTEQNTQRPTWNPTNKYCMLCGEWKSEHKEFCKPATPKPPPETGAVDVEKLAQSLSVWIAQRCGSADRPLVPEMRERIIEVLAVPLTSRITQLEQENATLHIQEQRRIGQSAEAMAELGAEYSKRLAAEARMKELEQKLEAALRLTTEQSIDNMRSKV